MTGYPRFAAALLAGASVLVFGQSAMGQTASAGAAADNEAIIVTGSRVIKNGDSSPSPLTVVSTDDIQKVQPTTIADGLNQMPVFSSPRGQFSNPITNLTGGAGGNAAANQLNLRNLGSVRNLILFDGMRVPSTATNNVVDVDIIPQMLLQRVDTVTGGVSAVYGSDAITGVVNFVTDTKFTGVKAHAQAGISRYGDGRQLNAGIAFGTKLGDRGHFEVSYEYRDDDGIAYRSDRPFLTQWSILGATANSTASSGTAANPYVLVNNVRLSATPFGGKINSGVLSGQYFATNNVLSTFNNGAASGTGCCQAGGDGGYFDANLKAKLRSHQVFGRFDYDVSDSIHASLVGLYNFKYNRQDVIWPQLANITISADNAFLAPAYKQALANAGQTTFSFGKILQQAPRLTSEPDSSQYWIKGGLDGKLGGDWEWGVGYSYAKTKLNSIIGNNVNNLKLAAAADAVVNGSGQTVCRASLTNAAYANCVPINLFGPTSASAAAIDYILDDTHLVAETAMNNAVAHISGSPFETWAGPVTVALSGEWRTIAYSHTTDALISDRADCSGLPIFSGASNRLNCNASNGLFPQLHVVSYSNRSIVRDEVKEGALEANVPLLKDSAIGSVNVTGAARYTKYKVSGSYWTWKVGLDWQATDTLRFRATRSRDIRAPTLEDLYAPTASQLIGNEDRLTHITPGTTVGTSLVPSYSQGNVNVKAEIGNTLTAGVVWKPAPRLSFAVDGYRIKITNAIQNFSGFTPALQDTCYASGGTSNFCQLQSRPINYTDTSAANLVTAWYQTPINIAEMESWGADFEANFATTIAGRAFSLRALATWQPHIYIRVPTQVTLDAAGSAFGPNGGIASPKLRVTAFMRYAVTNNVTIDVMERWRSAMQHSTDTTQVWIDNHVPSFATTNLNIGWNIPNSVVEKAEFFVNVQNLFDAKPPASALFAAIGIPGQFGGFAIGDDPVGRYMTAGVRIKF